jgi:hypothetical protein
MKKELIRKGAKALVDKLCVTAQDWGYESSEGWDEKEVQKAKEDFEASKEAVLGFIEKLILLAEQDVLKALEKQKKEYDSKIEDAFWEGYHQD